MIEDNSRLDGALQENVLTLLCFDDANCKVIRASVKARLFESAVFREVANHAIDFIDQYGEAIKEHLPDHLEHILKGDDERKARTYRNLLDNLYASRETINSEYVVKQLHKFVRQQNLKSTIVAATEALSDGRVDDAESAMVNGLKLQAGVFEGGLDLSNSEALTDILDNPEEEGFFLGIPELDNLGIIPRLKEMLLFMAPRGRGKTWFATHCAKQAILQRWPTVIITLEMSERRYGARLLQSFFSLSRRTTKVFVPRLVRDKDGSLMDIAVDELERRALMNPDDRDAIASRVRREFRKRSKLRVKEFPTGQLDLAGLQAYLDGLERHDKLQPKLLIVDYPDLMRLDSKNLRLDLGSLIAQLRGVAVERNMALVVMTQGNRESETATTVTGSMVAEDISKLATADTAFTYSQTAAEHKLGLARILVEKARNEESKMQILVTQAYGIGQFCIDSMRLESDYWDMMEDRNPEKKSRRGRKRDDDDGDD